MIKKIFGGSDKVLKITSVSLVVAAVLGCLIWIALGLANVNLVPNSDKTFGFEQNVVLAVIAVIVGMLSIALLICWMWKIINRPGKTLKIIIIAQAFILLAVLLIWCVIGVRDIITNADEQISAYKGFNVILKSGVAVVAEINNAQTEAIVTHILTILIYTFGVMVASLVLYGLVDGFGRVVCSLEAIAENSKKSNMQEHAEEQIGASLDS